MKPHTIVILPFSFLVMETVGTSFAIAVPGKERERESAESSGWLVLLRGRRERECGRQRQDKTREDETRRDETGREETKTTRHDTRQHDTTK
jgi:hypothetical protein